MVTEIYRKSIEREWRDEMRSKYRQEKFKLWPDLVSTKDYRRELGNYFGDLDALAGKRYLDLGAGFGSRLHVLLKEQKVKITNVDLVWESIKHLREGREPGIVAEIYKLPIIANRFDGVIAVNLINTGVAEDPSVLGDIFKEVYDVLNYGGTFIQSHCGFFVRPIAKDRQVEEVRAAGFDNLRIIEKSPRSQPAFPMPLTFIARKGEKK